MGWLATVQWLCDWVLGQCEWGGGSVASGIAELAWHWRTSDALSDRNARRAGMRKGERCVMTRSVTPAAPPLLASSALSWESQSACDDDNNDNRAVNAWPSHTHACMHFMGSPAQPWTVAVTRYASSGTSTTTRALRPTTRYELSHDPALRPYSTSTCVAKQRGRVSDVSCREWKECALQSEQSCQ